MRSREILPIPRTSALGAAAWSRAWILDPGSPGSESQHPPATDAVDDLGQIFHDLESHVL